MNTKMTRRTAQNRCAPEECGTRRPRQVSWLHVGVITLTAAFCAALAWTVISPMGGVDLETHNVGGDGTREVSVVAVIVSSLLMAGLGGALLRWWQGRSAAATRHWTILASVVALLSLLGPTSAVSLADGMGMVSLHAVVAAVVIVGLRRASRC